MFDLPSNIIAVVLCDWLDCYSLARLDAAQCNRLKRRVYLNVLSSREVTLHTLTNKPHTGTSILDWVSRRSIRVKKARLYFCDSVDEAAAISFLQTVKQSLEELKLQSANPFAIDMLCHRTSSLCPHLKSIHLHGNGSISGEVLSLVLRNCAATLTSLRLDGGFDVPSFNTFNLMPAMRCLSFAPGEYFEQVDVPSVVNLMRNCPNLVTFSYVSYDEMVMPSELLTALAQYCRQLQTLRCEVFDSDVETYQHLLESCLYLHTLDLGLSDQSAVHATLLHCRKLRTLRTNCLGNEVLMVPLLSARMPQMENLCINYFSGHSAGSLRSLSDQCFNLKALTLHFLQRGDRSLPASAFSSLLQNLVRVEMLDLWGRQTWLTDDLVLVVAEHCKRLRSIAFDGSKLQTATITTLSRGCPHLSTIHHSVSDRTLSSASNREKWRKLRPGLTFYAAARTSSEHWDALVFDS